MSIGILLLVAAATKAAINKPCAMGTAAAAVNKKMAMIKKLTALFPSNSLWDQPQH
jgi:hypothetical protein